MTDAQTTYDQATSTYDKDHERAPVEDNTEAIFETSRMSDCNAPVIQAGEAPEFLLTVLAGPQPDQPDLRAFRNDVLQDRASLAETP
jgi:hypothetical protein